MAPREEQVTIKPFRHLPQVDPRCFVVRPEFAELAGRLGLSEWTPVVWMGRLFSLDNDFGEHWFDNFDDRERFGARARSLGIEPDDLMILGEDPLKDGRDGPCHDPKTRVLFWIDVLKSLEVSYATLFALARDEADDKVVDSWEPASDVEETIAAIAAGLEPIKEPGTP